MKIVRNLDRVLIEPHAASSPLDENPLRLVITCLSPVQLHVYCEHSKESFLLLQLQHLSLLVDIIYLTELTIQAMQFLNSNLQGKSLFRL